LILFWLLLPLCLWEARANSQSEVSPVDEWNRSWRYYAPLKLRCQAYDYDVEIEADFTRLLKAHKIPGTFDRNSIRVAEVGASGAPATEVPFAFVPDANFDPAFNARGRLQFRVTRGSSVRTFYVYFDLLENGEKPLVSYGKLPTAGNWLQNAGFESIDQKTNEPIGWPLPRRMGAKPSTTNSHTGAVAVHLLSPRPGQAASLAIPGDSGLRVAPGERYHFSFWSRGENITDRALLVTAYWYDSARKYVAHEMLIERQKPSWDWEQFSADLIVPPGSEWLRIYIATYTTQGGVWVDDLVLIPEKLPELTDLITIAPPLSPVIMVEPVE
jgi:hypothetical protein